MENGGLKGIAINTVETKLAGPSDCLRVIHSKRADTSRFSTEVARSESAGRLAYRVRSRASTPETSRSIPATSPPTEAMRSPETSCVGAQKRGNAVGAIIVCRGRRKRAIRGLPATWQLRNIYRPQGRRAS
jgi:hypothetical protein